jgi:acyl-coenzyme A thioesterase PaaI-like protein
LAAVSDPQEIPDAPSYPPPQHALRDLALTTYVCAPDRAMCAAALTDANRNAQGAAALGFVSAVLDSVAAGVALVASAPDWNATADLSFHQAAPITVGPVVADARLVRVTEKFVVVGAEVFDGGGRTGDELLDTTALTPAGASSMTFARVPSHASVVAGTFEPGRHVGEWRSMAPARLPTEPLLERIGLRVVDADAGIVELEQRPYVANSLGAINGGVLGMVFQGAAEAAHPGMVAADIQMHYLSQNKVGPARTSMTRVRSLGDHAVCTLELVDAGNGDRLLCVATVTLVR